MKTLQFAKGETDTVGFQDVESLSDCVIPLSCSHLCGYMYIHAHRSASLFSVDLWILFQLLCWGPDRGDQVAKWCGFSILIILLQRATFTRCGVGTDQKDFRMVPPRPGTWKCSQKSTGGSGEGAS